LNSAENRLRVLMVVRPLHRRIHLSRLSQEVGPPLIYGEKCVYVLQDVVHNCLTHNHNFIAD